MNLWQYCFSTAEAKILYCDVLAEGSVSSVPIYKRRLVELCIRYNVQTVFIAHNHPSGLACPFPQRYCGYQAHSVVAERDRRLAQRSYYFAGDDYCSFLGQWALLELIGQSMDEEWLREIEAARQLEQSLLYAEEEQ